MVRWVGWGVWMEKCKWGGVGVVMGKEGWKEWSGGSVRTMSVPNRKKKEERSDKLYLSSEV